MLNRIINALVVATMAGVLVSFELGMIAPGDAFFIAAAIIVVFTGQQLVAREEMGFAQAATSMFTQPKTWRSRSSFAAYFVCLGVGVLVTAQALMSA